MRTALFSDQPEDADAVFGAGRRERLAEVSTLYPEVVTRAHLADHAEALASVEAVFSTWGMWRPTDAQLDRMPALRAVFHAAGATNHFEDAFLERGIAVFSAWRANAVPVAEFVAAQILLGLKGYFRNVRELRARPVYRGVGQAFYGPGAHGETVALLGDGAIATLVRRRLADSDLHVLCLPTEPSQRTVSLDEAFRRAFVVSNHLPPTAENGRCITRAMLASMRPGAVFINTGRGQQVDTDGLVAAARERPDATFLLDVCDPEPVPPGHPLWTLPNVVLTAHIAGSLGDEVTRMADWMIDEFIRWRAGRPTRHHVPAPPRPVGATVG